MNIYELWPALDIPAIIGAGVSLDFLLDVVFADYADAHFPLFHQDASSISTLIGTPSGSVSDIQEQDGNYYQVAEANAVTPGFRIDIVYKNVTSGVDTVFGFYGHYDGSPTHDMDVFAKNSGGTYDLIDTFTESPTDGLYTTTIPQAYTLANTVTIRLQDNGASGNPTHVVYIDHAYIQDEFTIVGRIGELQLVQNDGGFNIVSGELSETAQLTAAWEDLKFYDSTARSRSAGLALYFSYTKNTTANHRIGGFTNSSIVRTTQQYGVATTSDAILLHDGSPTGANFSATPSVMAFITRNEGYYTFIGNELVWNDTAGTDTTLYFGRNLLSGAGKFGLFRVADLIGNGYPVLGTRDLDLCTPGSGTGTSSIASPAAGNTFVHTSDFILTYDITTIPSADNIRIRVRYVDSNNYLQFQTGSTGNLLLFKVVGGSASNLGGSGSMSGGETVSIIASGSTLRSYIDGTLIATYDVSDFIEATAGAISTLGTGGVIANLEARTLDGIANFSSSNFPGYGLATSVIPGPCQVGDGFTHEINAWGECLLVALPTGATPIWADFRRQDANNCWRWSVNSSGDWQLYEVIAGTPTLKANLPGVLSGGERLSVHSYGDDIVGYIDNTLAGSYHNATSFHDETDGEITSTGDGIMTRFVTRPYDISNAPNTPGSSKFLQGLTLLGD